MSSPKRMMTEAQCTGGQSPAVDSRPMAERAANIRQTALLPSTSGPHYNDTWARFIDWKSRQTDAMDDPD